MNEGKIVARCIGTAPLLMHSARTVNPFDPITRRMREITSKRVKTDEDKELLARLEWEAGLYHDADVGPYIPALMIEATLRNAAKLSRNGRNVQRGLLVTDDVVPLEYDGPRDIAGLFADEHGRYISMMPVRVGMARVMRCRPIFRDWAIQFTAILDESILGFDDFVRIAEQAGSQIGFGDNRPRFGRFSIEIGRL